MQQQSIEIGKKNDYGLFLKTYLGDGHVQVDEEPRGGRDLQNDHHDHHHRHPHLGGGFAAFPVPLPGRGHHHVRGGLVADGPEVILLLLQLLLSARGGHGIPHAWVTTTRRSREPNHRPTGRTTGGEQSE